VLREWKPEKELKIVASSGSLLKSVGPSKFAPGVSTCALGEDAGAAIYTEAKALASSAPGLGATVQGRTALGVPARARGGGASQLAMLLLD